MDSSGKKRIMEAAEQLMLSKGYAAATVDEICARANLSKGAFFHYFRNKEMLAQEVLNSFADRILQAMSNGPYRQIQDPLQRVIGYIDFLIEMLQKPEMQRGCLLAIFSLELSESNSTLRSLCAERFSNWVELISKDMEESKLRYAPNASFSCQSLGEYLIAVLEGSLILSKAKQDIGVVARNLSLFKEYLYSLFTVIQSGRAASQQKSV